MIQKGQPKFVDDIRGEDALLGDEDKHKHAPA
jgi:hypothetical protein